MPETPFPATGMPDRDWWAALWPNPGEVVRSLGIKPGMIVLDLCCGDGYFTGPIARIVDGNVYGVDLDPILIDRARVELERNATSVLGMICADARTLEHILPGKVDFVLIANTFHGVLLPSSIGNRCRANTPSFWENPEAQRPRCGCRRMTLDVLLSRQVLRWKTLSTLRRIITAQFTGCP